MHKDKSKGFTLVELLVVIAIIGLLASVVIASVGTARAKSRDARRASDAKAIQTAIELYKDSSGGAAPANAAALATDLVPDYIAAIPVDPQSGVGAYPYSNADANDDTYYIQFTTERDGSLGTAGTYCVTSSGTSAAGTGCTEG